ncbi:nucleoside-diphosphate sugar epimerase [Mucilaginibacter sp. PPCGB 2223]|uniref:NAD-dependent epimerase/dehydratase family protein n=1 Tax=Mucilaginibacter sp. PPCGB 2223 TaxID=1886027 RepID=UPI0008266437|nr:NAD-dependent epimerase/dehydratase family protein [Mucilaginibacter sp. PPCGB 2223]OCX50339.1 nucleoside-diphosphate sugar epimerase [Mucilaginibacter sp. PPCGB 2223]
MILVTGATGFLGAEVAKQIAAAGHQLVCTKRAASVIPAILKPYANQINWVEADMLDVFALEDALQGVTQVYHCAAWVSFSAADKKKIIKTNVEGTANLVNLCVQYNIRLVHVSSIVAIGDAKPGSLITENNHREETPHEDGYAISKYESEMEVWRGIAEGLNAVVVNPSLIIGANAGTGGTGALFNMVRKGLKYYTKGSLGWVDVEDVARCMIALMNSDIVAQRYIISAENLEYKHVVGEAARCFGVKAPTIEARPWMLGLAWRASALMSFLSGRRVGIDKTSAQAASKNTRFDNAKIRQAVGIEFKPVSQSIKEICKFLVDGQ